MIALVTTASAVMLKHGASPLVVMPLMLVMGTAIGFALGSIIHFFKVQPFIVTLMGLYFCRGMAYIISDLSVTITNKDYLFLALTAIHIPFIPRSLCIYSHSCRSGDDIGGILPSLLHPLWPHCVCDGQ